MGNNYNSEYRGSSGIGSALDFNKDTYVPFLKKFITDNNIKHVTDLGCGDFVCGPLIYDDLDVVYSGYDAYKKVIDYNSTKFSLPKYFFTHLEFFNKKEDIKSGELCILKDVVQHWRLDDVYNFLNYLVGCKKFRYILLCNCCSQNQDNPEVFDDHGRPLSCTYFPLKKYNPVKLYNYNTKEVSVITVNP